MADKAALDVPAHPEGVKELEDLLERLDAGCVRTGEGDNGEDLYDVEGATDDMYEAAQTIRILSAEGVPVAWRWRHVPTVRWSYSDTKHPREDLEQQPLYAASTASPSIAGEEAREIGWLIERRYPHSIGLTEPRWYAERGPDGWHWWTQDASEALRFASKAEVEAFLAYRMIVNDPSVSVTEHVFVGSTTEQKA